LHDIAVILAFQTQFRHIQFYSCNFVKSQAMLTSERKQLILDILRRDGRVIAKDVAHQLALSEDTIRRDLRDMAAEGLLERVHGGAMPLIPPLPDFAARRTVAPDIKDRLGRAAAGLISPGKTIFLDGGTSTAALVRHLPIDMRLTVITHSPTIAAELEHHTAVDVILVGGRLFRHSMVAVGSQAAAQIALLRPDLFVLGVTAIHPTVGLSTGDFEEAAIKRMIAERSAETITLLTQEKLDAISPHVIMPADRLSRMVVPPETDPANLEAYRALGIKILRAD
jgi:DeoR/GlpR family transcriptional regulator of sugar metabolism